MKDNRVAITCLGDLAPVGAAGNIILSDIRLHKEYFQNLFAGSDVVFANLEAPFTAAVIPGEDKKYLLKSDPRVLDAFPDKFVFSIANNHILDYGAEGLLDTIGQLSKKGFGFTGAGKNLESAGKPVMIDCKGKRIGFLAAADPRYPAAKTDTPGLFPADPRLLCPGIRRLRREVDIVYVSIHMGMEFIPVPAPGMIDLAKQCRQAGAHTVFFHHAHCVSGHTFYPDGVTLWGAGNFLFPETMPYYFKPWFETAAWHISHQITEKNIRPEIKMAIEPLVLTRSGLPRKPDALRADTIKRRIDSLGKAINTGSNLWRLRLAYMCRPAYLKLFMHNYADIARRRGLKYMADQILSAVSALFLTRT